MNAGMIAAELAKEIKSRMPGERALEKVEVAMRELLNEVGTRALSLFSEDLLEQQQAPSCEACEQVMRPKEFVATTLRTTFGAIEQAACDYRCDSCKTGLRQRAFEGPPRTRLSPLFSAMLTLFAATWPEQIAAACALTTFGQKVSATTIHNLLREPPESVKTGKLCHPDNAMVCSDGILVNGLEKGSKIEAKVATLFSETKEVGPKQKVEVQDATFVASARGCWNDLGGLVRGCLMARGVTEMSSVWCVGDGAAGIWGMFECGVPKGEQQLDGYHLKKKVSERCKQQFNKADSREVSKVMHEQVELGDVDGAVTTLLNAWAEKPARDEVADCSRAADKLVAYLRRHQRRIENWASARVSGRNKGSGLQEKANDMVCGARCKEGEMHWSRPGLHAMLQHRCAILAQTYQLLQGCSG